MNYLCGPWHESFYHPHLRYVPKHKRCHRQWHSPKGTHNKFPLLLYNAHPCAVFYSIIIPWGQVVISSSSLKRREQMQHVMLFSADHDWRIGAAYWPKQRQLDSLSQDLRIRTLISQQKAWHSQGHVKGWEGKGVGEGSGLLFQSANRENGPTESSSRIKLKQKEADNRN